MSRFLSDENIQETLERMEEGRFKYIKSDTFPYENYSSKLIIMDKKSNRKRYISLKSLWTVVCAEKRKSK